MGATHRVISERVKSIWAAELWASRVFWEDGGPEPPPQKYRKLWGGELESQRFDGGNREPQTRVGAADCAEAQLLAWGEVGGKKLREFAFEHKLRQGVLWVASRLVSRDERGKQREVRRRGGKARRGENLILEQREGGGRSWEILEVRRWSCSGVQGGWGRKQSAHDRHGRQSVAEKGGGRDVGRSGDTSPSPRRRQVPLREHSGSEGEITSVLAHSLDEGIKVCDGLLDEVRRRRAQGEAEFREPEAVPEQQ